MLTVAVLAAACIRNLRQTFRYGGRQTLPSKAEIIAASVWNYFSLLSFLISKVEVNDVNK